MRGTSKRMDEAPVTRLEIWRRRLKRVRTFARRSLPFVAGVLTLFIAIELYNAVTPKPHQLDVSDVNTAIANAMASATPPPAFSALVYQAIEPSLVLVETKPLSSNTNAANPDGREFAAYRPGAHLLQDDQPSAAGVASGVIIDAAGDILTSLHIVQGAGNIQVTFYDGTVSRAQVSGTQPDNDIAVLQAQTPPAILVPATLGNPGSLNIGDEAYVVGNPYDLTESMTAGVISGLNRSYQPSFIDKKMTDLIQFDAAVNPGNSGGPLLDRNGQVMGIVIGLLNPDGQNFIGIGFAVPITTAGGAAGEPPD